jgi:hypothetical protein
VARERKTNRKGTRGRIGAALLGGGWPNFTASDAQWHELEAALGKPIPGQIRKKIGDATSKYLTDAIAEKNAPFVDDYKKQLAEIEEATNRLAALLFHGADQIDDQVAGAALAGTMAFENDLVRVIDNCRVEIQRCSVSGFIEHTAWDEWIAALEKFLSDAGLPHGIATSAYEGRVSPFVRFVEALQQLLPEPLRRHGGPPLAKEMMAARKRTRSSASNHAEPKS